MCFFLVYMSILTRVPVQHLTKMTHLTVIFPSITKASTTASSTEATTDRQNGTAVTRRKTATDGRNAIAGRINLHVIHLKFKDCTACDFGT